jgi:DNA polymerase-3 subunit delta'
MNTDWTRIVGHKNNIEKLQQMVEENRLPHALLFTGQEGIGKSLIAEALATSLLCKENKNGVPCGKCPACVGMSNDTHPDFYRLVPMTKNEYEGKPEKSATAKRILRIEQMRDMQERASRVPILSERSVIIIEGVETMQEAAANSILKTIEEPEGPVVFILITSHPAFLLDTIRSRCMIMEFGILSDEEIMGYLQNQGITEFVARGLASLADGSIGRAVTLQGERLQELHGEAIKLLTDLPVMTNERIWKQGEVMEKWSRDDLKEWLGFLAMIFRDMLLLYTGQGTGLYNQKDNEALGRLLRKYSSRKVDAMLKLVLACQFRFIRSNVNIRLTIEAFLIRLKDIHTGGF